MRITTSLIIPVTDGQVDAFSAWAKNTYGTYDGYLGACKAPAIDRHIRTHILPLEMKSILRETEPYVGVKAGDIHISRLQSNRKRILDKIKYMKGKLGKLAFPVEAAEIRRVRRDAIIIRRQALDELEMQQRRYFAEYALAVRLGIQFSSVIGREISPHTIVKKHLSNEDALMDCDCVICMETHKMIDVCATNCGHQFGSACFTKWAEITRHNSDWNVGSKCPLCRTTITEITKFSVEGEDQDAVQVAVQERSLFDQVMNVE